MSIRVAKYLVNQRTVAHAKRLIDAGQYVLRSDWSARQPRAAEQNAFFDSHSWDGYLERRPARI